MCVLFQPVQRLENVVPTEDVSGQEKDAMGLTTAETTLMKPTAVCLCHDTLAIYSL